MRLDEVGEKNENLKTKVISYLSNQAEQTRVGQADTSGPIDVDNVNGSEKGDEDRESVDEIQRIMRFYS